MRRKHDPTLEPQAMLCQLVTAPALAVTGQSPVNSPRRCCPALPERGPGQECEWNGLMDLQMRVFSASEPLPGPAEHGLDRGSSTAATAAAAHKQKIDSIVD